VSLYHSERGLYPFQVDDVVKGYDMPSGIVAWDTGTGKSHWTMATACLWFEDGKIDMILLIAERNKIADDEWVGDWRKFTGLTVERYHGSGRQKRLEKTGVPQVLVTTYETAKSDLVTAVLPPGSRTKTLSPGPLSKVLGERRIAVVYDEPSVKIANRSSDNYKAHNWYLNRYLRKIHPETKAFGLTATPLDSGWENVFNQFRLIYPQSMPTVKVFETRYIKSRDPFGRPTYYTERMPEFAALCQPLMLRRRKTDPELIDQFPKMVEEARHFQMGDAQRSFYEMVEEICFPADADEPEPGMLMLMRQIAGHPASILHSQGMLAQILVEELGADYIRSIPSVKTEGLVEYLTPLVHGQGAKVVVFTFFGPSMIPILAAELRRKKMTVFEHYGEQSDRMQEDARRGFRSFDGPAVFLTSDAGARGINLPEATYLVEYESALSFANRTQRINRIHRIDSTAPSTHAMTFFLDDSVEEGLGMNMAERNSQHDVLMDVSDAGEHYLTAEQRKIVLRIARTQRKTKRKRAA
jgi:SNF2 family DNA or RNA helicase